MAAIVDRKHRVVEDPPLIRNLFNSTSWSWIWVPVRLFLAYQWLGSAIWNPWTAAVNPKYTGGKIFQAGWMQTGDSLLNYWKNAVRIPETGTPPISFDWYRGFLQFMIDSNSHVWFAKVITIGEIAVGLGLLLGAFTGIAAWGGTLLNFNFLLAGSASTNGMLFGLEVFLVLAWKTAGYWGLDRWLLPKLGVPWTLKPVEDGAARAGEPFQVAPRHA